MIGHYQRSSDRVIPVTAHGGTAQNSANAEPSSPNDAVTGYGVGGVLRATGLVSAEAWQVGGQRLLVETDGNDSYDFHCAGSRQSSEGAATAGGAFNLVRRIRLCTARSSSLKSASPAPFRAMRTVSHPGADAELRTISRKRRLTRLRTTALPTRFPVTKQKRLRSKPLGSTLITKRPLATLRPRPWISEIRLAPPSLWCRCIVSKNAVGEQSSQQTVGYTDSRCRPLKRRRRKTARPSEVRERERKPCTRARRRFLGW